MKKYAQGGTYVAPKDRMPAPQSDAELDMISPEVRKMMEEIKKDAEQEKKQKGMERSIKGKKMAKGGYVRKADGCAQRGKTKGRMV